MKRVYFVRHGESESNAGGIRSGPLTPLTPKGYEQAKFIAERVSKLPIESMFSSTMVRARETAKIIAEKIAKEPEYSDLFVERKYPSEFLGKLKDDPDTLRVEKILIDKFCEPNFRYADEENFEDLEKRASRALQFLQEKNVEHILVVTHGFFLHVLFGCAVFGVGMTAQNLDRLLWALRTSNTGVTIFDYEERHPQAPWQVITWNDHAHLAD